MAKKTATYSVVPIKDGTYAIQITHKGAIPFTISGFKIEEEAKAYIEDPAAGKYKLRRDEDRDIEILRCLDEGRPEPIASCAQREGGRGIRNDLVGRRL
jgi:hypothetical protein